MAWFVGVAVLLGGAMGLAGADRTGHFQFRHWTKENGLPDDAVTGLAQTADGYLWVGTRSGLARFDGLQFRTFDRGDAPELGDSRIRCLAADADGGLWVRSGVGYLVRLGNGGWGPGFDLGDGPLAERSLIRDASGRVWMRADGRWSTWVSGGVGGSTGTGSSRRVTGSWSPWIPGGGTDDGGRPGPGLASGAKEEVVGVFVDPAGWRWTVVPGMVTGFNPATGERWTDSIPRYGGSGVCVAVFAHRNGRTWFLVGAQDSGDPVVFGELSASGIGHRRDLDSDSVGQPFSLLADRVGNVWTVGKAVRLRRLYPEEGDTVSLPGEALGRVTTLFEDREGLLWVGTDGGGLYGLLPKPVQAGVRPEALPHPNVRSVLADASGRLWVGTEAGLVLMTAGVGWDPTRTRLPGLPIRAIASADGGVWVGTSRGVYRIFDDVGRPEEVVPLPRLGHASDGGFLGSLKIRSLLHTRGGDLWIAAAHALSLLPAGESEPRLLGTTIDWPLTTLHEDRWGHVWVGVEGMGLAWYRRPKPRELVMRAPLEREVRVTRGWRWFAEPDAWLTTTNALSSPLAWGVFEDSRGDFWVACDNGLNRLPRAYLTGRLGLDLDMDSGGRTGLAADSVGAEVGGKPSEVGVRPFTFTERHGLPDHQINSLIEDGRGQLWFGTDRGLFRVKLSDLDDVAAGRAARLTVIPYHSVDGLPDPETNGRVTQPTVTRTPDGRLWFATVRGVQGVDPEALARREVLPQVAIEEVRANDVRVYANVPKGRMEDLDPRGSHRSGRGGGGLRVGPGMGRILEIRFAGLSFVAPEKCSFRYQMVGYENEWHDVGTRRVAYYTNLDPGRYRFQVMAYDHHRNASAVSAELPLELEPFLWQTWQFRALSVLVVLALVWWAVRWRIRDIRRWEELERQNAVLRERASIARDIHDELGPRLTQLALLVESGADTGSQTGQPNASLSGEGLLPGAGRVGAVAAKGLGEVPVVGPPLSKVVQELMGSLDATLWAVEPSGDTLDCFADYLMDYATDFLSPTGIGLKVEFGEGLGRYRLTRGAKRHLLRMVQEALNNVVHHSRAGLVSLRLLGTGSGFILEIADNGVGLPEEAAQPGRVRRGFGLGSLRSRARELGARFEIRRPPGGGTSLWWEVPAEFAPLDGEPEGKGDYGNRRISPDPSKG